MVSGATTTIVIQNRLGLHARPAMMFVETAMQFESSIKVGRTDQGEDGEKVDGKSIMQMMMLAATCGTELCICADGPDADNAIKELVELVKSNFSED